MSNTSDFVIENGVLKKYVGPGGDVVVPEGVTDIDTESFSGCSTLTGISFPDSLRHIRWKAFSDCKNLMSLIIPCVSYIGSSTFARCSALRSLTVFDGIYEIEDNAFLACSALQTVQLPDSIQKIDNTAFFECNALRDVVCPSRLFASIFLFDAILAYLLSDYELGEETKRRVFARIRRTPKKYYEAAIQKNSEIAVAKLIEIAPLALDETDACISLANESKSTLALAAILSYKNTHFSGAEIEALASEKIGKAAGEIPLSLTDWKALYNLKLESGKYIIKKYVGAEEDIIVPDKIDGKPVVSIDRMAFRNQESLKSVILPTGIKEIGNQAFDSCARLERVELPKSLRKLNGFLFRRCVALKEVVFPEKCSAIEGGAFSGCSALENITLPSGVTKVCMQTFEKCVGLQSVALPDNLKAIEEEAFVGCKKLRSIRIPDGTTRIGASAFTGCTAMCEAYIPASVEHIQKNSFEKCPKLTLHAPAGSYAEQYAKEHNIPFVAE